MGGSPKQPDIAGKTEQTAQEKAQYSQSFDLGNLLEQVYKGQLGLGQMPQGYLSPEQQYTQGSSLNQAIYGNVLNQAQNPLAGYQSTLAPNLQLAQDSINKYYNARGLTNSGIAIGQMGQAGVDLAIQEAQNEMAYQQQSLQNALGLSGTMAQNYYGNLGNLANLYSEQQQFGLNSLDRQARGAITQYQYQPQYGTNYGGLGGALGMGAGALIGNMLAPGVGGTLAGAAIGGGAGRGLGMQF